MTEFTWERSNNKKLKIRPAPSCPFVVETWELLPSFPWRLGRWNNRRVRSRPWCSLGHIGKHVRLSGSDQFQRPQFKKTPWSTISIRAKVPRRVRVLDLYWKEDVSSRRRTASLWILKGVCFKTEIDSFWVVPETGLPATNKWWCLEGGRLGLCMRAF